MSSIDRAYGYIAILTTPFSEEERETIQEEFDNTDSNLGITYDGKCIYYDFNKNRKLSEVEDSLQFIHVGILFENDIRIFFNALEKANIKIEHLTAQPFNCIWYNGCDCPLDTLTAEQVKTGFYKH